jgi:hypothetical protein
VVQPETILRWHPGRKSRCRPARDRRIKGREAPCCPQRLRQPPRAICF